MVVAFECGVDLLREVPRLSACLVDRYPELCQMRDVHQQVIHKELYLASVVRAKNIGKTQAILRAKRVIAYKGAQTILGQILKTFNLKSIVEILHESIDKVKSTLIVVDKPPFMPTHTSHGHYDDTLANALAAYFAKKDVPFVFRPINRLDRNTSGLVLVAKNKPAASFLSKAMREKKIRKTYVAVLDGYISDSDDRIALTDDGLFVINRALHRTAESIIVREVCDDGLPDAEAATTHFRILKRENGLTLVEAHPITGRTHQLRVHFAHIGCPILGDDIYGTPSPYISRHALHAAALTLPLPSLPLSNGAECDPLSLSAPLPKDMEELIEKFFNKG